MPRTIPLSIISLLLPLLPHAYSSEEPIRAYVHHSELQRRSSVSFMATHLRGLLGHESILDIGCGDGRLSADLSKFVPEGVVTGIDPSEAMLIWAKKQYPSLEYPNLFFQKGDFLRPDINSSFDLIVSTFALQHCPNQLSAFRILKKLLKPKGKLLLLLHAFDNEDWNLANKTIKASPKWSSYFENREQKQSLTVEDYQELLSLVHLRPLKVQKIQTIDPFIDRQEFLQFLVGSFTPPLLQENAIDFHNELIDEYLRLRPSAKKDNGVIEAQFGKIEIVAEKL